LRRDQAPPRPAVARGADCIARVNRAIDFIVRDLGQPLNLHDVALAAGLSPYHFHRVFRALVGETLGDFTKRLRLERALHQMAHRGRRTLTEIALASGFASSSDFSRSFKQRYGLAPSAFDLPAHRARQRAALQGLASDDPAQRHRLARLPQGDNPDGFAAVLRRLPARSVAYLRVADSFRPGAVADAAARLVAWADAGGVGEGQWLGYMWDDPNVVALADCRYDVAVDLGAAAHRVPTRGEIGRFDFPAMQVAEVVVRGDIALEMRAFDWLYGTWLPASGFVPADQPCFEAWIGRPFAHGIEHFELRVWLPVERGR
jgi:AraC family transcriptional regulator